MARGTIARLMDRGFGFIKTDGSGDLFFHRNELEGVEFNSLREGQEVEFEKGQGRDGRPAAVKVRLADAQEDEASSDAGDADGGADDGADDGGADDSGADDGGDEGDGGDDDGGADDGGDED
ncbi:MAG: cold shock domain-containing protein [Dehalococcoidales bacterium]|nr:cold shock domain-containing protein [Dehalococcoidales bacterium]